jgi:type II secretory pathway pseudopilin PulG
MTRRPNPPRTPARQQRGITMFVAMIILIMVTLLAVSSFRGSNTNLKVVSSMQGRQEAIASAQAVIEDLISLPYFSEEPVLSVAAPKTIDINNDGIADYTVRLNEPVPTCLRAKPVVPAQLDLNNVNDRRCLGSARAGAGALSSFCSDTVWEITAKTEDRITGAATTVRQGVALRVAATDALTACK